MKKSLFFYLAFLLPISLTNYSCTEDCKAALADLVTDLAIAGVQVATANVPFNIPNIIKNTPNLIASCSDDAFGAGNSKSRIQIDFDRNQNGNFIQNEVNSQFDVPPIPPLSQAEENYTFRYNEPGEYRVITFADDANQVEEQNEDNNASNPKIIDGKAVQRYSEKVLIIRVLPNPNYKRGKEEPFVELVGRTVKVTPI